MIVEPFTGLTAARDTGLGDASLNTIRTGIACAVCVRFMFYVRLEDTTPLWGLVHLGQAGYSRCSMQARIRPTGPMPRSSEQFPQQHVIGLRHQPGGEPITLCGPLADELPSLKPQSRNDLQRRVWHWYGEPAG